MILFLNTVHREGSTLALISQSSQKIKKVGTDKRLSEILPTEVANFLTKNKIKPKALKKIVVVKGPGSFVGTRTGVAIANSLAWALEIPILGLNLEDVPENLADLAKAKASRKVIAPTYSAPPNITVAKKKKTVLR